MVMKEPVDPKFLIPRIRDRVYDPVDERHVGVLEWVSGTVATVVFQQRCRSFFPDVAKLKCLPLDVEGAAERIEGRLIAEASQKPGEWYADELFHFSAVATVAGKTFDEVSQAWNGMVAELVEKHNLGR